MFLFLTYWIIAGVTAEDVSEVYYRLKSSSVCLHVKSQPPYKNPEWKRNRTFIASPDETNPAFANKVDYFKENNTLCIRNLMHADSGIYEFSFRSNFTSRLETHQIIVKELVPRPVIAMSVLSVNVSAGVCNMSVNCSVRGDWLLAFCDGVSCSASQASLSEVSIAIFALNWTIVCNGSNSVSTKQAYENITETCQSQTYEHEHVAPSPLIVIVFVVCLCLVVFLIGVAWNLLSKKHDQASTAHLIQNQQVEAQTQPDSRVSTSSSIAYENVASIRSSQARDQPVDAVHSVYSVLQPPKANPPPGTGGQKTHQAPAPQADAQAEAEQPGHIDTVYSMLQKPRGPTPQHQP